MENTTMALVQEKPLAEIKPDMIMCKICGLAPATTKNIADMDVCEGCKNFSLHPESAWGI